MNDGTPIDRCFRRLARREELALMPYLTAGYPNLDRSMEHLQTLADHGADLIELGIPFSDPVADGPAIQQASFQALASGTTLRGTLEALSRLDLATPVLLMSYLNPLIAFGRERLIPALEQAGVCGLIVPDLPIEESEPWHASTRAAGLDLIYLLAPTSTEARIREVAQRSSGFVYYVSLTGTTGVRRSLADDLEGALARVKLHCKQPVAVGFGISEAAHVRRLRGRADGAVVGSRIIEAIRGGEDLADLIRGLKAATRS